MGLHISQRETAVIPGSCKRGLVSVPLLQETGGFNVAFAYVLLYTFLRSGMLCEHCCCLWEKAVGITKAGAQSGVKWAIACN